MADPRVHACRWPKSQVIDERTVYIPCIFLCKYTLLAFRVFVRISRGEREREREREREWPGSHESKYVHTASSEEERKEREAQGGR